MQPFGAIPKPANVLRRRVRRVVYTCLFGYSERFNDFSYADAEDIDFICFTDDAQLSSSFWQMRFVPSGLLDPARQAKRFKTSPHRFLPDYDWSLYIDNIVRLKASPRQIFDQYLAGATSPYVCFRHHARDCVYAEADEVIRLKFDDPARVQAQMDLYRRLGYPAHNGLAKGAFILRRHEDPILQPVMERWFEQILCHSKRDQLSLNPVMWKFRFEPSYLPLKFFDFDLLDWPIVKGARLPRDFDDGRYLRLNPDVTSDPRRHFLNEGAAQGRLYK
jgi:alkaline ceramidase TOD1/glycosyltransferase MUCI70-like protein